MIEYVKIEDAAKAFSVRFSCLYDECLNDLTSSVADGTIELADVAPVVHGKWIKEQDKYSYYRQSLSYHCSVCGRKAGYKQVRLYDYCPKCGAKMDMRE